MTEWTPDTDAELSSMWNNGETATAIGGKLGISRSSICGRIYRLRASGAALVHKDKHGVALATNIKKEWTDTEQETLVRLYASGVRLQGIASVLGVSRKAVARRLDNTGIGPRRPVRSQARAPGTWKPPALPAPEATQVVTGTHAIAYAEARMWRHCHFPLWDHATPVLERQFCGNPVVIGESWCPYCMRRVFAPVKER